MARCAAESVAGSIALMPLEELYCALVFLRSRTTAERAEVPGRPVFGSFFREYSRYSPDFSFLIISAVLGGRSTSSRSSGFLCRSATR
jgi:hypothetical protein